MRNLLALVCRRRICLGHSWDRGKPRGNAGAGRESSALALFLRTSLLFYTSADRRVQSEIGEIAFLEGEMGEISA